MTTTEVVAQSNGQLRRQAKARHIFPLTATRGRVIGHGERTRSLEAQPCSVSVTFFLGHSCCRPSVLRPHIQRPPSLRFENRAYSLSSRNLFLLTIVGRGGGVFSYSHYLARFCVSGYHARPGIHQRNWTAAVRQPLSRPVSLPAMAEESLSQEQKDHLIQALKSEVASAVEVSRGPLGN